MSQVGPSCAPSAPSCVGSPYCERVDSFSFSVFRLSSSLCCLLLRFLSFILGRLVVKYKEILPCLSAAYLVGVCMSVCVYVYVAWCHRALCKLFARVFNFGKTLWGIIRPQRRKVGYIKKYD